MFTLSEIQSQRRARASLLLLNAGLLGSFLTILLRSPFKVAFALVIVAALVLYGLEMRAILRARKRRALDWGLTYFLTAISLLAPLSMLAGCCRGRACRSRPFTGQLENVYGFLAFLGVVSFAIMGMLYKIIPFLVWYARYSKHIGLTKVPSLADLYSPGLQVLGYWTYLSGLAGTSIGIVSGNAVVVRCGCALLALSLLVLAANLAKILSHLIHPTTQPLSLKPAMSETL